MARRRHSQGAYYNVRLAPREKFTIKSVLRPEKKTAKRREKLRGNVEPESEYITYFLFQIVVLLSLQPQCVWHRYLVLGAPSPRLSSSSDLSPKILTASPRISYEQIRIVDTAILSEQSAWEQTQYKAYEVPSAAFA